MKRVLCLYIPFLSTDRLLSSRSAAGGPTRGTGFQPVQSRVANPCHTVTKSRIPVATITPHAQSLGIVHANQTAYDLGVRPGQMLADAKAIVPDLVTYQDDPASDRRQLESLAVWAGCLSPIIHIEGDDSLLVDVTGCERLFDGEANLLRRAIDGLCAQGVSARGAIADTAGAAWALAHAHGEAAPVAPPGQSAAYLSHLPVWSLRINARTAAVLASLGVETVASLLHLPRSSLALRFGDELLERIDQALGEMPEVLTPYRPQPALTSRCRFGAATTRIDVLQEAIRRVLERFCEKLSRQVTGVCQMFVTFYCPDVMTEQGMQTRTITLPISLSRPTRSVERLLSLLLVLLDELSLPAPADSLMLWAHEIHPLDDRQDELFVADSSDARRLGDLLDRLAIRLGPQAVVRPELLSEHQPERAFRYVLLVDPERTRATRVAAQSPRGRSQVDAASSTNHQSSFENRQSACATPPGPRPLRLSPRPVEIAATAIVPEGPPIAFRLHGTQHGVTKSVGPERIETGWWRGPHLRRDYYRVTTEDGRHCWLFRERDTGRWFLHGWFD